MGIQFHKCRDTEFIQAFIYLKKKIGLYHVPKTKCAILLGCKCVLGGPCSEKLTIYVIIAIWYDVLKRSYKNAVKNKKKT